MEMWEPARIRNQCSCMRNTMAIDPCTQHNITLFEYDTDVACVCASVFVIIEMIEL